jgi:hypothetical protein
MVHVAANLDQKNTKLQNQLISINHWPVDFDAPPKPLKAPDDGVVPKPKAPAPELLPNADCAGGG